MATVKWAHVEEEDMAEIDMSQFHASLEHSRGKLTCLQLAHIGGRQKPHPQNNFSFHPPFPQEILSYLLSFEAHKDWISTKVPVK